MVQFTRKSEAELTVTFDVDPAGYADILVIFTQHGKRKCVKGKGDMVIEDNGAGTEWTLRIKLSPEETGRFNASEPAWVQIQLVAGNGAVTPSNVDEVDVVDIA